MGRDVGQASIIVFAGDLLRPDALTGRLDCLDGRYRYRCERGHQSVTSKPYLDVCTAELRSFDTGLTTVCGADIELRILDYRGEGG